MRYVDACEVGGWHLHCWHRSDPIATSRRMPYTCRSWRHEGPCRLWKGAQDWVRVTQAIERYPEWVYVVLTFAQNDWPDKWALYRSGVKMWSALRKRLIRRVGMIQYVQTWERHRKGGAHVNILIRNGRLYGDVAADYRHFRSGWLEPNAVACGFGMRTWVEPMRAGSEAMAGYLTKLSRELTGSGPKGQTPVDAPPHFRRLRASRGLLPPVHRSAMTGRIVFCPIDSRMSMHLQQVEALSTESELDHDPDSALVAGPCGLAGG